MVIQLSSNRLYLNKVKMMIVEKEWTGENGLEYKKVRSPFGVIAVIYEARPNVTSDVGGLCLKSGNASILRGSSF